MKDIAEMLVRAQCFNADVDTLLLTGSNQL